MPEHLQDSSSSGELLTERIDQLEDWIDQLEGIDVEPDSFLDYIFNDESLMEDEKETAIEAAIEDKIQELKDCDTF